MSQLKKNISMPSILQSSKWIVARCKFYLTKREIPWRLRPAKNFVIALVANPWPAIKYARRYLIIKNMSVNSFMLQALGSRLLKETMDICRQLDIHPFLSYGSLLGYCRDGSVIDTDDDIDLGVLESEAAKLPLLKEAMVEKGYHVRVDSELELSFMKKKFGGLYIDFWIHRAHKASNTIYSGCMFKDSNKTVSIFAFTSDIFAQMKTVRFLGVEVFIPHQPEEYLLKMFGEDWRTPLDREYTFSEKTEFMYHNRFKITEEEYYREDFL